jgi:integrase
MTFVWEQSDSVRHTREDALGQREFQLLLEGCYNIDDEYYAQQARFCVLVAGRLGLRVGEITHMKKDWIDLSNEMIQIPKREECTKGRGSATRCGYCKQAAKQAVEHNEDLCFQDAVNSMWHPKTEASIREVPYGFDPQVSLCIERFFDRYDEWPLSRNAVNRRVKKASEKSDIEVYPHALRATAATSHASRGLDVIPLKSLMGWAQLSTAHNYVADSGQNTARELDRIYS